MTLGEQMLFNSDPLHIVCHSYDDPADHEAQE